MNDDQSTTKYAYGRNTVGTCGCPAIVAGFNPDCDQTAEAAEYYDDFVRDDVGEAHKGVVNEEIAKHAWMKAIDLLDQQRQDYPYWENEYEAARDVAKALDWM